MRKDLFLGKITVPEEENPLWQSAVDVRVGGERSREHRSNLV